MSETTVRRARCAVLVAATLLGVCVAGAVVRGRVGSDRLLLAAVWLLPMLLPLRGLLEGRRRTHAWATLCVVPYLVFGIVETIANPPARAAAAAMALASLVWFATLVAYLRVTRPMAAVAHPPAPSAPP
jgi:uncharacterized membrane protein